MHRRVVVKPGETLKCDPGELYCAVTQIALEGGRGNENVEVFVKVNGNILLMATLSAFRHPQYATELVFEKEFEILHTSKMRNISVIGYRFSNDDENKEANICSEKLAAPRHVAAQSSKPKVTLEKRKIPGKLSVVGRSDDGENAEGKNRPVKTPLKTPVEKKAKKTTSFTGKNIGVVVRPGETVKCDPGEIYCHLSQIALQAGMGNEDVRVFVKVSGQEILLGTLSVGKYPQHTTSLVFDKEFELLHTSKTSNIFAIGYKFTTSDASTGEDDESDDEVPLAIPLYSNSEESATTQSAKPKPTLEEAKSPGKVKADVDGNDEDDSDESKSGDDEDSSDEDDSENSDEGVVEEDSPKKAKANIRPAKTPLKTSLVKKAKIETPSKTGSSTAKKSGHVHVETPHPLKKVKKTPNRQHL
ncbi:hypothetical protein EJB05_18025, partial [Eragrostis curvula]